MSQVEFSIANRKLAGATLRGTPAVLAIFILLGTPDVEAARDFSKVEIEATQIAGRVYMLKGAGGHMAASVGEDGILLVDDQFAPLAAKIEAALAKLGPGKLRFVLNTHWHPDHTGANAPFGEKATIIAHTNVRRRLIEPPKLPDRDDKPAPKVAWPVVTFDHSLSVHFNGEEIKLIHVPASHTDGDSLVWFTGSGVVHLGDLIFPDQFPYVDIDSGGDVQGLIEVIDLLLKILPDDATLLSGHGPPIKRDGLERYRVMLHETTAHIRGRMAKGESVDAIKAARLPKKWASWSWKFIPTERWIEIVHRSYSRAR